MRLFFTTWKWSRENEVDGRGEEDDVTVITVFRSRLRPGVDAAYGEVAAQMSRLVREVPGFVDEKFFLSADGERVTLVRFRDAEAQHAWAQHPDHLVAQRRGRAEFYESYDISVSEETYARVFHATDVGT